MSRPSRPAAVRHRQAQARPAAVRHRQAQARHVAVSHRWTQARPAAVRHRQAQARPAADTDGHKQGMQLSVTDGHKQGLACNTISSFCQTRTPQELFDSYDLDKDGYWDQNEQWRMLKDLLRGLTLAEHHELFDAFQVRNVFLISHLKKVFGAKGLPSCARPWLSTTSCLTPARDVKCMVYVHGTGKLKKVLITPHRVFSAEFCEGYLIQRMLVGVTLAEHHKVFNACQVQNVVLVRTLHLA
eukprot:1146612-Pelagomonas_calceolata.AAC.2